MNLQLVWHLLEPERDLFYFSKEEKRSSVAHTKARRKVAMGVWWKREKKVTIIVVVEWQNFLTLLNGMLYIPPLTLFFPHILTENLTPSASCVEGTFSHHPELFPLPLELPLYHRSPRNATALLRASESNQSLVHHPQMLNSPMCNLI